MRAHHFLAATALPILALAGIPATASVAAVPTCEPREVGDASLQPDVVDAHRRFELPVIHYPFGQWPPRKRWRIEVDLLVEPTGSVRCYSLKGIFDDSVELDDRRRQVVASIGTWKYEPFLSDGRPVAARITEYIDEEEDPRADASPPVVPLGQFEIRMSRTSGCYGSICPTYSVVIRGDGRASYVGRDGVDVIGSHEYPVPVEAVAALVASIRKDRIWGMRESFDGRMNHASITQVELDFGGSRRTIRESSGGLDGMPDAVRRLQDEVDRVARRADWEQLSLFALERLEREGYDFHSKAAGEMLQRALVNDAPPRPGVIERLLELGAPIDVPVDLGWGHKVGSTLEAALADGRAELVPLLAARGALDEDGKRSQARIDSAFRIAIGSGNLAAVEAIWNIGGPAHRPSLTHDATSVAMLLQRPYPRDRPWDPIPIARWLRDRGVDLASVRASNGDTLLHHAAEGGSVEFVRFLLQAGVDPNARGKYDLTAMGSTHEEDVAMALLEGGADPYANDPKDDSDPNDWPIRKEAEDNQWHRVVRWLDAHPDSSK